jgi:hypothetical protein
MLFMPESPRFLMHKGKTLEAYKVWRRIRGVDTLESKEEFFVMKASVEEEEGEVASKASGPFPWMDFIRYDFSRVIKRSSNNNCFRVPRCRRAIIYANIMIFLGQFTGVNAIMYYMSVLMSQIGFDSANSNYSTYCNRLSSIFFQHD